MSQGLDEKRPERWLRVLWHALACVIVMLVPTLLRLGLPYWALEPRFLPQVLVLAIAYLAVALAAEAQEKPTLRTAFMLGLLACSLPLLLLELTEVFYSRAVVLAGLVLGYVMAVAPQYLSRRLFRAGLATVALLALTVVPVAVASTMDGDTGVETTTRNTALHNLRIIFHKGLVPPAPTTGGGIGRYGDGFLIANGVGEFYRLDRDGSGLRSRPLEYPPLLNRQAFLADNAEGSDAGYFRVMDLLVDTVSVPNRVLVSHYHWDSENRCVSIRLSALEIDETSAAREQQTWETLFIAQPCIPWDARSSEFTNHAGGRIAWTRDGGLLLSVGDMRQQGREGSEPLPQIAGAHYGKVLRLRLSGEAEVLSYGHRNPQGLSMSEDGTIWSTEHGPRGGDELNRIVPGANYGWPFATYGTSNDSHRWPLSTELVDHGPYSEPLHAWVPSVGVSQVIQINSPQFPNWSGDVLVASMAGQSLFRLRIRSDRVVYSERIPLGRRLRDMVDDGDGRLIIWTDEADVISIEDAGEERTGEVVYGQCAVCHESSAAAPASAPSLRGVMGRRAGAVRGFAYSEAMRTLDLTWNPRTLDQFLWDPNRAAPGTTMVIDGLGSADREAVIRFLEAYQ